MISLVILLAYTTHTTLEKGFSQYKKETQEFEKEKKSILIQALEEDTEKGERESLIDRSENPSSTTTTNENNKTESTENKLKNLDIPIDASPELLALLESERATPWDKVNLVTLMVVVTMILNLLKGGGHSFPSPLGFDCGSYGFYHFQYICVMY